MKKYEILLVDDDPHILTTVDSALSGKGHRVTTATGGEAAFGLLSEKPFDLIIVDFRLSDSDASGVLMRAKERNPQTRIIALTGEQADAADIGRRPDIDDCLVKPHEMDELLNFMNNYFDEPELERGKQRSEASIHLLNKQILNMLMVMSHDIRGPLVSMGAALKLLDRGFYGKMDEDVAQKLSDLRTRVEKLVGIAEDFLCKAFSANDDFAIEQQILDLKQDIIDPVLDELSCEIRGHAIKVQNHFDMGTQRQIPIKACRIWLKTVFRNLFRNAVKYGGNGCTITIGFEDKSTHYRLNVYNSGKPIPEEHRDKLFTKFARMSSGSNGRKGGMGLGLYLIKEIIQQHGGDIWYEPREDGSDFIFTLPH